jgi:hypothetical protein
MGTATDTLMVVRCPYCVFGEEFRPMIAHLDGRFGLCIHLKHNPYSSQPFRELWHDGWISAKRQDRQSSMLHMTSSLLSHPVNDEPSIEPHACTNSEARSAPILGHLEYGLGRDV